MQPAVPASSSATKQDVLDAPEHMVAELIDGELYLQPRPAARHAEAVSVLGGLLIPPFRLGRGGPGGWWIQYEPELHLRNDVLVPDLAGWRREILPAFDLSVAYVATAPQWICEVLSPSTAAKDRIKKLPQYARAGVGHAWLIEPEARTLEIYRLVDGHWVFAEAHDGPAEVRAPPFDAVSISLSDLWLDVTPPDRAL